MKYLGFTIKVNDLIPPGVLWVQGEYVLKIINIRAI